MSKKPKQSSALARLADCVTVAIDGKDVRVPVGAAENKVLNCLLVSRLRAMTDEQIKKYNDKEVVLTPRELKDLIDSVSKLTEASAAVYSQLEGTLGDAPQSKDPLDNAEQVSEVKFDDLTKPKTDANPASP